MNNNWYLVAGLLAGAFVGFLVANNTRHTRPAQPVAGASAQPAPAAGDHDHDHDQARDPSLPSDEEIAHGMQVVDSRPDSYDDQLKMGKFLLGVAGRPKDSIKYFKRAAELRPKDPEPAAALGNAYFDASITKGPGGDPVFDTPMLEKAAEAYERALAIDPKSPNVRTDLGLTWFFRTPRDVDRAIAEYRKSLEIDPRHPLTLQNMAAALIEKGDLDAADRTIAKLQEVAPENEVLPDLRAQLEAKRGSSQSDSKAAGR